MSTQQVAYRTSAFLATGRYGTGEAIALAVSGAPLPTGGRNDGYSY